jgi:hypothetical protein
MQNKHIHVIDSTLLCLAIKAADERKAQPKRIGLVRRCLGAIKRVIIKHFYGVLA